MNRLWGRPWGAARLPKASRGITTVPSPDYLRQALRSRRSRIRGSSLFVRPLGFGEKGAVDPDRLAANEGSARAGEEDHGGSDIRRGTDPSEGSEFRPGPGVVGIFLARAFGFDGAGRYAVYPDSVLPQFDRRFFGEHFNSAFARGVGDERGERKFVAARTEVHDRSSA